MAYTLDGGKYALLMARKLMCVLPQYMSVARSREGITHSYKRKGWSVEVQTHGCAGRICNRKMRKVF